MWSISHQLALIQQVMWSICNLHSLNKGCRQYLTNQHASICDHFFPCIPTITKFVCSLTFLIRLGVYVCVNATQRGVYRRMLRTSWTDKKPNEDIFRSQLSKKTGYLHQEMTICILWPHHERKSWQRESYQVEESGKDEGR